MVQQEMRITAQAVATLSFNLIGYLPAPFIYGVVSDLPFGGKIKQQRFALASVLYVLVLQSIFLGSAFIMKYNLWSGDADRRRAMVSWQGDSMVNEPFGQLNGNTKFFRGEGRAIDQIATPTELRHRSVSQLAQAENLRSATYDQQRETSAILKIYDTHPRSN
jgi:hypothetical protein